MHAMDLLLQRRSTKKLIEPAPNAEQLEKMIQAAMHAPDHGKLKPYRFVVIDKAGQDKLEHLLISAVEELNLGEERKAKAHSVSHRAPMIIAVVAKVNPDLEKVPGWEQMLCAGCATYGLQLAANAQGFDNVWVTGPWVEGSALRQALGCGAHDKVIALVMIGTAEHKPDGCREYNVSEYLSYL
ncbi:nitroreductase family protein [Spirabiliibacterium falconis]|uniref:nitroreductase family protein n=1 Tax=Spirabiliibacterium falconis TaxID=572023 RepID=UPI001AACA094|nr:nitroreductase family protein [Spirabiliibacterium falconis]MBE2893683.1 nitroreductase [Spirabiliibacterium falconis]